MRNISQQQQLDTLLTGEKAVLLLYGGHHCGVCQALKPQLSSLLATQFPRVTAAYIDCQQTGNRLCAQQRIMTLPLVQIWFEGRRFSEFFQVFSVADIQAALTRPYQLLFSSDQDQVDHITGQN